MDRRGRQASNGRHRQTPDTSSLSGLWQKSIDEKRLAISPEGTRMVSSLTRNQVPGNRLRVRIPCPPLLKAC